jgi:hypothetical protein
LTDIEHLKKQDMPTSLSLVLDVRKREEQQEEAWRAKDDVAWRRITGSVPNVDPVHVANPQDAMLMEGANIVADMTELQHG